RPMVVLELEGEVGNAAVDDLEALLEPLARSVDRVDDAERALAQACGLELGEEPCARPGGGIELADRAQVLVLHDEDHVRAREVARGEPPRTVLAEIEAAPAPQPDRF